MLALSACDAGETASDRPAPLAGTSGLITLIDACAAGFVTPYGAGPEATPFLARLAAEGHLFEDVTAPAPYTLASVASLFTGEHVDVHGVTEPDQILPIELATLAEGFARAGYRSLGLSTNAHVRRQAGAFMGDHHPHVLALLLVMQPGILECLVDAVGDGQEVGIFVQVVVAHELRVGQAACIRDVLLRFSVAVGGR